MPRYLGIRPSHRLALRCDSSVRSVVLVPLPPENVISPTHGRALTFSVPGVGLEPTRPIKVWGF